MKKSYRSWGKSTKYKSSTIIHAARIHAMMDLDALEKHAKGRTQFPGYTRQYIIQLEREIRSLKRKAGSRGRRT